MQFKNGCYKVAIELQVVQFWSEITLVISNRTRAARPFDFKITRMISDQIARPEVQLPLLISLCKNIQTEYYAYNILRAIGLNVSRDRELENMRKICKNPRFPNCASCEKYLKVIKHNSLHLARKYNQILVQVRQYLLLKTYSFPEATLSENCLLLGTDKFQRTNMSIFSRQMEALDFMYAVQE